jgi:hypothetical protein
VRALPLPSVGGRDLDDFIERLFAVEHDERGHELGDRRDRHDRRDVAFEDHLAGLRVDDQRHRGADFGAFRADTLAVRAARIERESGEPCKNYANEYGRASAHRIFLSIDCRDGKPKRCLAETVPGTYFS